MIDQGTAQEQMSKAERVLETRPQWSVDLGGRLYATPRPGSGGALRAGWMLTTALRAYLQSHKSHRWSTSGQCSRCGVRLDTDFANLECAHPSKREINPAEGIVACPLVDALGRYLDVAICRARFAKKRGVWPAVGEALLQWEQLMPDDPLEG